jgi:hypothetical protein
MIKLKKNITKNDEKNPNLLGLACQICNLVMILA